MQNYFRAKKRINWKIKFIYHLKNSTTFPFQSTTQTYQIKATQLSVNAHDWLDFILKLNELIYIEIPSKKDKAYKLLIANLNAKSNVKTLAP